MTASGPTRDATSAPSGEASTERVLTDQGRQRQHELLGAAMSLFAERGFAATRVRDICERAGVAKGLFYWYFPTKHDLFAELVRSHQSGLRRAQGAAIDTTADPVTRIRQGTVASVEYIAAHSEYFELVDAERADPAIADDLRRARRVYLADVEQLIVEAQHDGLIDDRPAHLLATGVLGTVGTFTNSARRRHTELTDTELAEFVADWVVRALSGDR